MMIMVSLHVRDVDKFESQRKSSYPFELQNFSNCRVSNYGKEIVKGKGFLQKFHVTLNLFILWRYSNYGDSNQRDPTVLLSSSKILINQKQMLLCLLKMSKYLFKITKVLQSNYNDTTKLSFLIPIREFSMLFWQSYKKLLANFQLANVIRKHKFLKIGHVQSFKSVKSDFLEISLEKNFLSYIWRRLVRLILKFFYST